MILHLFILSCLIIIWFAFLELQLFHWTLCRSFLNRTCRFFLNRTCRCLLAHRISGGSLDGNLNTLYCINVEIICWFHHFLFSGSLICAHGFNLVTEIIESFALTSVALERSIFGMKYFCNSYLYFI